MTRDIKFRAWLPDCEEMIHTTDEDNGSDSFFVIDHTGIVVYSIDGPYEGESLKSELYSDAKVMQFTGLHDKNEVEIYEGDIVKAFDGTTKYIGCVEYDCASCAYWVIGLDGSSLDFMSSFELFEVVGNICENPGSLEA